LGEGLAGMLALHVDSCFVSLFFFVRASSNAGFFCLSLRLYDDVVSANLSAQSRRNFRPFKLKAIPNYTYHVYISHSIGVS
jgi:hypothetical protein